MTKGELIRYLEPFEDETKINATVQLIAGGPWQVEILKPTYIPSGDGNDYAYVTLILERS